MTDYPEGYCVLAWFTSAVTTNTIGQVNPATWCEQSGSGWIGTVCCVGSIWPGRASRRTLLQRGATTLGDGRALEDRQSPAVPTT